MNIKVLQINEVPEKWIFLSHYLFQSRYTSKKEKTMHSNESESGLPDEAEQKCIVFSCFEVYRDWNRWSDDVFTFLVSDVSISWGYLLVQMPLWQPLYLHWLNIHCCRCSFDNWYICNLLFFELADTFQPAYHIQMHLHLVFSGIWGCFLRKFCIYIPRFL